MTSISHNLQQVQERISAACARAQRPAQQLTLLAVSKTWGASAVREAYAAGQTRFGENYIQEAVDKIEALRDLPLEWHCIGPIQSNKSRLVAENFDWVHTVDRLKIAQRLSDQRPTHLPPLNICLQVNVDGGASKSGVEPAQVLALAAHVAALPRLCLRGIMSIPEPLPEFEAQLAVHRQTRAVFESVVAAALPGAERFDTLSMGMSTDLESAVLAGSTMVRVGTAIFGGRPRPA